MITYDEAFNTTTSSVSLTIDHTTPTLSAFSAAPNPAPLGPVQLVLTASESLNVGASSVTVHGATVPLVSQSGQTYTYQYVVSTVTPQGTAPVAVRLVDFAGNSSVSSSSFTVDRLPPAAVNNLAASTTATAGTFSLSWTAPSDDGPTGRAGAYFVRYATYSLTQANFGGATLASGIPTPAAPGTLQSMQVTGLLSNVTYYFALRSSDTAGNLSALSNVAAAGVFTDTAPPVTSVFLTGTQFSAGGNTYISSSTTVGLSAQDGAGGSGVAFTEYRIDGGSFITYSAPFTLSEGVRLVEYRSRDNAGNVESLRQATFRVDATRPQSSLTVGTPQYNPGVGSPLHVSAQTLFGLSAADPTSNGVSSGVDRILFRTGSGAFQVYSASFTLSPPDGLRAVEYRAVDRVENAEVVRSLSVALDSSAPVTTAALTNGVQLSSQSFVGNSSAQLVLSASDPSVGGVASGILVTRLEIDNGGFQNYTGPVSLPAGQHFAEYFSRDRVENIETVKTAEVMIDTAPPVIALISPAGGQVFRPGDVVTVDFSVTDDRDAAPSVTSAYLEDLEEATQRAVFDGETIDPLSLDDGQWRLVVRAQDWVGNNSQALGAAFTVIHDTAPPVISAVSATNIGQSSATISWNTNEPSDTQVEYGTTTSYGSSTVLNTSLVTAHTQGLTGLTAGTVYNYRVKSRDAAGNLAVSGNFTFTTAPPPDVTPPVISAVVASNIGQSSATI
ncbi:MAG: OmpL47-type beta-barrel domain-containing protein, partial [Elusimicrobiota bacterium]